LYSTPHHIGETYSIFEKAAWRIFLSITERYFSAECGGYEKVQKKGFRHRQLLKKGKELYRISDTIGCMSPANVECIGKHHPQLNSPKVEVNPLSIEPSHPIYMTQKKTRFAKK